MAKEVRPGPISGWRRGEVVRTTSEVNFAARPGIPLPAGERLVLQGLERVQDGQEVWVAWRGTELWGLTNEQAERIVIPIHHYGPFGWKP